MEKKARTPVLALLALVALVVTLVPMPRHAPEGGAAEPAKDTLPVSLPRPRLESSTSLEEAINARRSIRSFSRDPLTLAELSQLLWAAQGITHPAGRRTAPSAGALYPLKIYAAAGNVTDLPSGIYRYEPEGHVLVRIADGDPRRAVAEAAHGQASVRKAAVDIVISAVYSRTTGKYGERGIRYAHLEAGHAAQNVLLQSVSLQLGSVVIGAFSDDGMKRAMRLAPDEQPLYIIPVGRD
jgi:SagB-type dehydrogenase family enzyme